MKPGQILTVLFALVVVVGLGAVVYVVAVRPTEAPTPGDHMDHGTPSAPPRDPQKTVTVVFTYGSEKKKWIAEVTELFHRQGKTLSDGRAIRIEAIPMGSGESMQEILKGRREVHLVSPASAAFIKLGNAESRTATGDDLVERTENLVLSPVVIAMWKPMAEALGWPDKSLGWSDILAISKNDKGWAAYGHPEWGRFKFGHTHPESSNSGLISLFAEVYAGAGKVAGLTVQDVARPEVAEYLRGIEQAVVHYGSSTGFFGRKMFAGGPSYLSAAVLYENMVIESAVHHSDLPFPVVAIYPREGTFWSDHPCGIVKRSYVTEAHREAARMYLDFLLERPQQERALAFGFRPALPEVPLGTPVDAAHGADPDQPQTTLEVPSTEVMAKILELWHRCKKSSRVVLCLDVSGSMRGQKIVNARNGAVRFVDILGDRDEVSLLTFSSSPAWVHRDAVLGRNRDELKKKIGGLFANGKTSLYDAVAEAHRHLMRDNAHDRIKAVVVLTDGKDTTSRLAVGQLVDKIRLDSESRSVRVFTIRYGDEANLEVLTRIGEATGARCYQGSPETIEEVFREISTFF